MKDAIQSDVNVKMTFALHAVKRKFTGIDVWMDAFYGIINCLKMKSKNSLNDHAHRMNNNNLINWIKSSFKRLRRGRNKLSVPISYTIIARSLKLVSRKFLKKFRILIKRDKFWFNKLLDNRNKIKMFLNKT
jgi:hypothetical protein